ncbi:MAG: FAD-dependent monooxygenase [Actinomycetota bacterium]|nr:FAD-dependent monooxygenase [Actinomycetota bacterium]
MADASPVGSDAGRGGQREGRTALVVGGSLAGLSAANWLCITGWAVEVLERARLPLEDHGAGLVLHPSTSRFLTDHAGMSVGDFSVGVDHLRYLDGRGEVVSQSPSRLRFSSYGALYRELRASLAARGGTYRHGITVTSVSSYGAGAEVTDSAGRRASCDLVVAADGVRSAVRRVVDPAAGPTPAGYVAWRGVVAEESIPAAQRAPLTGAITYCILERSHVLTYPIRMVGEGRILRNWVWYRNLAGPGQLDDLLVDRTGARHDLSVPAGAVRGDVLSDLAAAARTQLPPPIAALVEATGDPFMQVVVDVLPTRMTAGRICLVGDAGFVARPHSAAGTAKAAEEARLLAEVLAGSRTSISSALAEWAREVSTLGRALVARSRRAGERAQTDGTWAVGEALPFGLRETGDSERY